MKPWLFLFFVLCAGLPPRLSGQSGDWKTDFQHQPVVHRPQLEVSYTDASRKAFQIQAEAYHLIGELQNPHLLYDPQNLKPWLWMELTDKAGERYNTVYSKEPSRINLYRRGPYYCEIHWLDIQLSTRDGTRAPLKGDLALFCYPEKILAEITWHSTEGFEAEKLEVHGISPNSFVMEAFQTGTKQSFSFPIMGEEPPLTDDAFELIAGEVPFKYDKRRGCYVVGTHTSDSFQKQFYEFPNRYETATFRLKNNGVRRKIYICHESAIGGKIVEGGVVLDKDGHPIPLVVQVSKNFDGEKEEKLYNPEDTPFSETYFPLYLEPYESQTLSSLHLYQNWGRHMTKHWSSLGAWMDYFHSSTGVTETTCYVPFKFAGLGGVAIADFRAMSQESFWKGQPQHDNLAGHSFLSFYDGKAWQHSVYQKTVYRSTGPNWFDIGMEYLSADSSIRLVVDIWETPQADELRSFFRARYEVLRPLRIENAQTDFRFLSITSAIQRLRFTRFACNGTNDLALDMEKRPFPVKGISLPKENAYLAEYGDHERIRGSNGVVIRKFSGPEGIGPAVSLQLGPYKEVFTREFEPDTRLLLVPNTDRLDLVPGDVFEIDGFWLPYGPLNHADPPRKEIQRYGQERIGIVAVDKGKKIADLPATLQAIDNEAVFTLQGGKDLIPVIVSGLTDWRYPRIWQKEQGEWRLLSHARNTKLDGTQVFCDSNGTFGAVFLVPGGEGLQDLKVTVGEEAEMGQKISVFAGSADGDQLATVKVTLPWKEEHMMLSFPGSQNLSNVSTATWKTSEAASLWFESAMEGWDHGGRITPNEEDLDLEYWWQIKQEGKSIDAPRITVDLSGTIFADPAGKRTWVWEGEEWDRKSKTGNAVAVTSSDGQYCFAMVWPHSQEVIRDKEGKVGLEIDPLKIPVDRRFHLRGKVYLVKGTLDMLAKRISRETQID